MNKKMVPLVWLSCIFCVMSNSYVNSLEINLFDADAKCFTSPIVNDCTEEDKEIDFWYYNPKNGTCVKYRDGQCPGNANGFEHEMDCYAECSKAICAMGADRTNCQGRQTTKGVLQRWFMNITSGRCEQFPFSNCLNSDSGYRGGNSNNYLTEKDCADMCRCKDDELPGMKCHPSLINLKSSTIIKNNKTNSTSQPSTVARATTTSLLKTKQQNSTKLPQNLFTSVYRTSTESSTIDSGVINRGNEIMIDPHHGHNHHENHEHEHPHAPSHNQGTSFLFSFIVLYISLTFCSFL